MNGYSISFFLFLAVFTSSFCSPRIQRRDVQSDASWNDEVASLVQDIAAELLEKEGSYIDVDDFYDTFGGKLLDGKLKATGGSIGNFSTLRFVNVSVATTSDSLTVAVQIKVDQLEISFSSFDASIRFMSLSGGFKAAIGSNLVSIQVTLELSDDGGCSAALDVLEVSEFEDIDLTISGVDFVSEKFVKKIANSIVNKFTPELRPMAEDKLRQLVLPYLSLACEYLE